MVDLRIVTGWTGPRPNVIDQVIANHQKYAELHGYAYSFLSDAELPLQKELINGPGDAHWIKPFVISEGLKVSEFVFWIDLDSVFHDLNHSLSDLIDMKKDFIFTGDHNDLFNGGHLFFRQGDFSSNFIHEWESIRNLKFPRLNTTQQGVDGHVGDQVAMNYLLAGGLAAQSEITASGIERINETNGWVGNPDRTRKDFHRRWAPVTEKNLKRSRKLIAQQLRPNVDVVVQHRLNAYPWWGPKRKKNIEGPIIHFVPPYKDLLPEYLEKHSR